MNLAIHFTKKSIDDGSNAAHGPVEDDWQLVQALHLVSGWHIGAVQSGLEELLSVHNDVRPTQVHGVTEHVQEAEPALDDAVGVHRIHHGNHIIIN